MSELTGESTAGTTAAAAPAADNSNTAALPESIEGKSWRDSLPDDLKSNATLGNFTDVASLAKAHVHAQSLIGKKGVFVPGENASAEEVQNFYKAIGLPEADKYTLNTPEGKQVNPEFVAKFKDLALKNGILPKQAQQMMEFYIGQEEAVATAQTTETTRVANEAIAGLRKEWGDGYEKQLAFAKLAVKEVGGEDFKKHLESTGLGNDVRIIKLMASVGKLLGEDKLKGDSIGAFGQTAAEVQIEIDKIKNNKESPYYNSKHLDHKNVVSQMESLYRKMYPNKG